MSVLQTDKASEQTMKRALPFVIIALVLGAAFLLVRYLQSPTPPPAPVPTPVGSASPAASVVNPGDPGAEPAHTHGNADAPVTLEEFGDFECPPCACLASDSENDGNGFWPNEAANCLSRVSAGAESSACAGRRARG